MPKINISEEAHAVLKLAAALNRGNIPALVDLLISREAAQRERGSQAVREALAWERTQAGFRLNRPTLAAEE